MPHAYLTQLILQPAILDDGERKHGLLEENQEHVKGRQIAWHEVKREVFSNRADEHAHMYYDEKDHRESICK